MRETRELEREREREREREVMLHRNERASHSSSISYPLFSFSPSELSSKQQSAEERMGWGSNVIAEQKSRCQENRGRCVALAYRGFMKLYDGR
jgi:hypothetical protein